VYVKGVVGEEGKKLNEVQRQASENCLSKSRMPPSAGHVLSSSIVEREFGP
jgi:hypothetical protein